VYKRQVFLSALHNPYQNLALEHGLFQSLPAPSLFLYTNTPCVVIGRAQNPWVEANLPFMQMQHIPLVRRQSGGGTVVHDLGNLNFSFISPKAQHNKTQNLQIILHALQRLGIPAEMNERHDLILQGKKISGSAFRETRNNCFHHGTLLIDADLPMLREALAAPPRSITTNAVKSVRSSVMNLRDFNSALSLQQIQAEIIQSFLQYHKIQLTPVILGLAALDHPLIQAEYNLYQSHEWLYHKTLPFEEHIDINGQAVKITVENGVITHCQPLLPQCSAWIKRDFSLWSLK
jgi:lipoate-protein ligase A